MKAMPEVVSVWRTRYGMLTARHRLAALALMTLLGSACYESAVPIDDTPQLDLDDGLLGVWRCLPFAAPATEPPATLAVTRSRERVYAVSFQETGSEADFYEGHPSRVGETTLINLRELSGARPGATPWVFVRATLLRPSLLEVAVVSKRALARDLPAAALREELTRRAAAPDTYDAFCACVRAREAERVGADDPRSRDDTGEVTATDDPSLRGVAERWKDAYNAGDAARVAALYTDEGQYLSAHVHARGREAVRAYFQKGIDAGGRIEAIRVLESWSAGSLAYAIGTYQADNAGQQVDGRILLVLRRCDGEWRIAAHEVVVRDQP